MRGNFSLQACRETLRKVGHELGSKAAEEMFKKVLQDEGELHYGEFMNDLAKILVKMLKTKCPQLFLYMLTQHRCMCVLYILLTGPRHRRQS